MLNLNFYCNKAAYKSSALKACKELLISTQYFWSVRAYRFKLRFLGFLRQHGAQYSQNLLFWDAWWNLWTQSCSSNAANEFKQLSSNCLCNDLQIFRGLQWQFCAKLSLLGALIRLLRMADVLCLPWCRPCKICKCAKLEICFESVFEIDCGLKWSLKGPEEWKQL